MKSISTSGLLKLIETRKINCSEISLLFNPNIDYVLLIQGLYDVYKRDKDQGKYNYDVKESIRITFSYMCLHYPELAKQYINSIRAEHELMAILSEDNIKPYLSYYIEKTNNNLEEASKIKNSFSAIYLNQAEIVGELLVERWYPLLKKFFTEHKNVVYMTKHTFWSDSIISYLVNPSNKNILLENILPIRFFIEDYAYKVLSSCTNIEDFSETIYLKRVKGKSVTDFEALSNKLKALEEIDLIVTHGEKIEEQTLEELYPIFSVSINVGIQDTIDLNKIPFDSTEDYTKFKKIKSLTLKLHVLYKDGYYRIFSKNKKRNNFYILTVGARHNNDDSILVDKYTLDKLITKYEKYLISQIKNTLKNKGCKFKVKAPELIWCDMHNPLIDQILKIYEDKKEDNQ
ncbi:MAG: hypothetical protein NC816_00770 [Candidatus Omnitrophica bacterium]|nr:hypothetical protein [Candidatus Omnitrophota bacterium]